MRAVRVTGWGVAPTVDEVADPVAGPATSIVRIEAATVAHIDHTIWAGRFLRHPPLPYTPGVEGAGTVVESGRFEAGERVWIRGGGLGTAADGTWAELVAAPDESLGVLPADVPFDTGAAFFSPCASAWTALHRIGELRAGQCVAVTGAAGAVGSVAVQLALDAGAEVVATVSRQERLELLPDAVTGVVVTGDAPVEVPPVDLLVDTVGGAVLTTVLPAVRPGGRAVLVGYLAGHRAELDLPTFIQRDVSVHPLNMVRREAAARADVDELFARLADGRIGVDVTTFPLDEAAAALDWLESPDHRGRAVLRPGAAA
ncbi:NADPH:quinone oxidoreductase family protein [soil metagenome]